MPLSVTLIKQQGVFLFLLGWDASPSKGYPPALNSKGIQVVIAEPNKHRQTKILARGVGLDNQYLFDYATTAYTLTPDGILNYKKHLSRVKSGVYARGEPDEPDAV